MDRLVVVSEALRFLMRCRGLSSRELAARADMSQSQLSRYLRGTTSPQLAQLDRLLDALDCDLETFGFAVEILASVVDGVCGSERLSAQRIFRLAGGIPLPEQLDRKFQELFNDFFDLREAIRETILQRELADQGVVASRATDE